MSAVTVRRVRADEDPVLQAVRLAALSESPSAFGSSHAAEVDQPADHWASRAAWVSPSHRRAGIAAELVQAVLGWADETGATTVELWVTRGNDAAVKLYEAAGLRQTGDHQPLPSDPLQGRAPTATRPRVIASAVAMIHAPLTVKPTG